MIAFILIKIVQMLLLNLSGLLLGSNPLLLAMLEPEQTSCMIQSCQAPILSPHQVMTERIIDNVLSHGRVLYRLWCNGLGICRKNWFDCSGLIDRAWRDVWYWTGRKLNSARMIHAWDTISYRDLERGDYVRFERKEEWPDHIAIVSRWRDGQTIEIIDMFDKPGYVSPREIKIYGAWWYAGKFRIHAMRMDYTRKIAISKKTGLLVRL